MLWLLAACGYAKLMPIARLEPKRREQGQYCGAVLDPFCYVDFLSKRLLPSFTAKACPMRFFLCLDFLDQAGRRHYAAATAELLQMSLPRLGHITLLFSGGRGSGSKLPCHRVHHSIGRMPAAIRPTLR